MGYFKEMQMTNVEWTAAELEAMGQKAKQEICQWVAWSNGEGLSPFQAQQKRQAPQTKPAEPAHDVLEFYGDDENIDDDDDGPLERFGIFMLTPEEHHAAHRAIKTALEHQLLDKVSSDGAACS